MHKYSYKYDWAPQLDRYKHYASIPVNRVQHNNINNAGGPSAAEFTGSKYFQILISMLQNESETHRLRLVS